MSNPTSQLVLDLIKNISDVSKSDSTEFSVLMRQHLESSSTFDSYLTGMPEKQYVHCLSQSLQSLSETAESADIRAFLWNPIVASLVKCISTLSSKQYQQPSCSKPPGTPSISTRKSADKKTVKPAASSKKKEHHQPAPKGKANAPGTKTFSSVLQEGNSLELGKGVATPSSTSATKVDPQFRLRIYQELQTINSAKAVPFFNQMKGGKTKGPVTCKTSDCSTCQEYFTRLPITKCADIQCHGKDRCSPSGWYPHVLPHIWAKIKYAHKNPVEVQFIGFPDDQIAPIKAPCVIHAPLPTKRSWALRGDVESSDSELDSIPSKVSSPQWSSWAEEVEAASLPSPTLPVITE